MCLKTFPKGTDMVIWVNAEDGKIFTTHICKPCEKFIDEHNIFDWDGAYEEGCVAMARMVMEEEEGEE